MSKDDKTEYTPDKNVAAENVADENVATQDVTSEPTIKAAKPKTTFSLSRGAIIGLSAAGVAIILGAGFAGAAIGEGIEHNGRGDRDHSMIGQGGNQMGGQQGGQMGGQGGQMGGKQGGMGDHHQGQMPNGGMMPGENGGGIQPQQTPSTPGATSGSNGTGTPQAFGGVQAPHGFTGGS